MKGRIHLPLFDWIKISVVSLIIIASVISFIYEANSFIVSVFYHIGDK